MRAKPLAAAVLLVVAGYACSSNSESPVVASWPTASTGACQLPSGAKDHGTTSVSGSGFALEAGDTFFNPTCVTGLSAGSVTVTMHNGGKSLHNFSISALGIDKDVPLGQTVTITLQLPAGSTPFFCKYHKSSGMVGELVSG